MAESLSPFNLKKNKQALGRFQDPADFEKML